MRTVSNEVKHGFMGWLASTYNGGFAYTTDIGHHTIIRVCKNESFDYLYAQRRYQEAGIERRNDFDYAGLYCKQDGRLYDDRFGLQALTDDVIQSTEELREQLKQAVRRTVERQISNDRRNLQISELSTERERKELAYYQKYSAVGEARKIYLDDTFDDGNCTSFCCGYTPDRWTEDSLLGYILNPARYAETEAETYMGSHQEEMLIHFLCMDAVAAAYAAILENPLAPIHKVKRIMAAVKASPAKMVTVTICKDGIEFTFKTEAHEFRRDYTGVYSRWNIAAPDRREFERLFGRTADYGPDDILRITYARAVLYQA